MPPEGGEGDILDSLCLSVHLSTFFVPCAMTMTSMLLFPFWVCELSMRRRCAWACHFALMSSGLEAVTLNLDKTWKSWKNLVSPAVAKVLMLHWPVCVCGLPSRGWCPWACNFAQVTFEMWPWIENLVAAAVFNIWMLHCPVWVCQLGVGMHGHVSFRFSMETQLGELYEPFESHVATSDI